MSYLITCSGSKQIPTLLNPSSIDNLSFNDLLSSARKKIILEWELESDNQLNWEKTLPAWKLYSGNRSVLYNRIEDENWTKPNSDIKILSALFGWIKHTDKIPVYNLRMDDKIGGKRIFKFWESTGLLDELITEKDISLLSQNYLRALNSKNSIIKSEPDIEWLDRKGFHKGRWLNEQLSKL